MSKCAEKIGTGVWDEMRKPLDRNLHKFQEVAYLTDFEGNSKEIKRSKSKTETVGKYHNIYISLHFKHFNVWVSYMFNILSYGTKWW